MIRCLRPALTLTLAAIVLTGCFLIPEEDNELAPPLIKAPDVSYDVIEIKPRNLLKKVSMSGILAPVVKEHLFFRTQGGRIIHLHASAGDEVLQGQVIAELNAGDLEDQVELRGIAVRRAKLQLEKLRALGASSFDVDLASLGVREAEIQRRMAQKRLAGVRLISPVTGPLIYLGPDEGDYVEPFQIIATVVDPTDLILECASDKARDFPRGTIVEVDLQGAMSSGRVVMNPRDNPDPEYRIRESEDRILIDIQNLPSGASMDDTAIVHLVLARRDNIVVVPKYVLKTYSGRTYVNVLIDGVKQERDVELGVETATEVEIINGLKFGDLVVSR